MSIYGELDEAPTRSPLMEDASNRRALEEAEREDAERPARRAHTNQAPRKEPMTNGPANAVPWPAIGVGALVLAFAVLAFAAFASIPRNALVTEPPTEQAPAVAPASPQQPAAPAPTTWAPAAAEIPVGFTPGGADSTIAQGTPYTFLGGVEYQGGVAYCAIAVPHKDEGNVEHEARAWGACDALGIAPPPPPAAPVQAAPVYSPPPPPQQAVAPTDRPASDMTPLPTDVPAGWHPPFAPGYDPSNYVTNPEARP